MEVFYARVATLAQTITPTSSEHANLFYSWPEGEKPFETACIGHLRGDFGSNGTEFWTSWWPHTYEKELKTQEFKDELNTLVNQLRKDSLLKDRATMQKYCREYPNAEIKSSMGFTYGFEFVTSKFIYMLRCFTEKGDYNFYLYCYDKEKLGSNF